MSDLGSHDANRRYYDAFAKGYERRRAGNDPGGYHDLLDELESEFLRRFAVDRSVLEVGCGTGLILERIKEYAASAQGVDLSERMLEHARARGLDVEVGSATDLPFADESFDVTCSFKVLAHVPDIQRALSEMARVTRPGGFLIAEFYNPFSFRGLAKRIGPAGKIAARVRENAVYTRFDSPRKVRKLVPPGCRLVATRGIRIVTPAAAFMGLPVLRDWLRTAERRLCDSPIKVVGGFYVAAMQKG